MSQPRPPAPDLQSSDIEALLTRLRSVAKFKERSYTTSKNVHIPLLRQAQHDFRTGTGPGPVVCLVGDSMFERMTTTGRTPNFVAPWPSPFMLDETTMSLAADLDQRGRVFNAGVGGDRIQNIAYRLAGTGEDAQRAPSDSSQEEGEGKADDGCLPALLPLLASFTTIKLWVVQAGTNNMMPKKGLRDADREALRVLLRTLLDVNPTGGECRVLVTGLFYRRDLTRELVDKANDKIRLVVDELNEACGGERVAFLPACEEVNPDEHLEDHVHLTPEGYRLWTRKLAPAVLSLLTSSS
ncbi:hypothetical protein VTJ83DRAFT_5198 [Remersonia thermophila]|uniref:SGNH hydrolase-type esterase domain-containing protein n=1 Tax=Remersonia thermophila TaxID=72144 RepID=A0ABR4DDM2_9PEZI